MSIAVIVYKLSYKQILVKNKVGWDILLIFFLVCTKEITYEIIYVIIVKMNDIITINNWWTDFKAENIFEINFIIFL